VPTDKDGDGIPNAQDKCPDEAEDKNGFEDEDGCPDEPKRQAMLAAQAEKDRQAAAAEQERKRLAAAEEQRRQEEEAKRQRDAADAQAKAERDAAERKRQQDERDREAEAARIEAERKRKEAIQAAVSRRRTGFILGGVGLGLGALGIGFAVAGNSQYSSVSNGGLATGTDIANAASTGKTLSTAAVAFGAGCGILVFTGGVLVLTGRNADSDAPTVAIGTMGGATGLSFSMKLH
jgi:membrane protein involved in colicin uptake